jgi:ribonuclease G
LTGLQFLAKEISMSKELFISSSPHETKVAVLEDDGLVEVFFQRDTDEGLVGGIYKGRVSRVLPGMQSAFVDIGLERDAFLYVSDFFEDSDEYDRLTAEAETRVIKFTSVEAHPPEQAESSAPLPPDASAGLGEAGRTPPEAVQPSPAAEMSTGDQASAGSTTAVPVPEATTAAEGASLQTRRPWQESREQESRGRGRRRRRGRGFEGKHEFRESRPLHTAPPAAGSSFEVLPGESLARHGHTAAEPVPTAAHTEENTTTAVASTDEAPGGAPIQTTQDMAAGELALPVLGAVPTLEAQNHVPAATAVPEQQELRGAGAPPSSLEAGAEVPDKLGESPEDRLEEDFLAGNLRVTPVSIEPDAPSHHIAEATAKDLPIVRPAFAEPGNGPDPSETTTPSAEAQAISSGSIAETEEGAEITEAEEDSDEDVTQASETGETTELEVTAAPPESPGKTGERSYTLREQSNRPRFAPRRGRRGRGRFNRGPRPEGGGRRQEQPRGSNEQTVQINEVLKEGQEILVQIAKEPLGTKGARITSHVALPGRYLVYMPTIHHIGVSRKIGSEEERLRLRNIILEHRGTLTGGIIVRTAATGRSEEELKADVDFLARLWNEIRTRSEQSAAPALIHRDLTLVERILRDTLSPDFKCVRVDNETEYQGVLDFVHRFQPSLVGHVKLYTKDTPMFEEFGVQAEIDKALKPKVWLKSGGYIVINQTEALVAIDVNTGKYVGKTNRLEDTIVKTNIDAVKEIVRQVRLRDLGGIIVIDFIDMDDRRNRMKVVQALEEALRSDRAPTKILSFNEFGLVALTRKRVKQSLERTLSEQCPYCAGSGWIKSAVTVCYEILEEVKKMAHEIEGDTVTLRVNPEVVRILRSREGLLTAEIEKLTGKDLVIKSDSSVHQERFEIF